MRLIDADALLVKQASIAKTFARSDAQKSLMGRVMYNTEQAPTIDAEPVRHGRWIDENCSVCGQYVYGGDVGNYCPNCGAKMCEVAES